MKKKTTSQPRRQKRATTQIILDRSRLTFETRNYQAGRADLTDPSGNRVFMTGHAPRNFHVNFHVERDGDPWLWIGTIASPPHDIESERTCFAVIGGDKLREIATAVLGRGKRKRGAR